MNNFQIETAQNVTLNQNVANLSTRIGAYIIDALIISVYYLIIILAFNAMNLDFIESWAIGLIFMLPPMFYSLIFEILWNGQTPGKRTNHIRVVKLDGSKPTMGSYLTRWLLRIIDISLASGSIAILTILFNGKGQRLGDIAAGTTVISLKPQKQLRKKIWVELPENYVPTYPQVTILTDKDLQTITDIYRKGIKPGNQEVLAKLQIKISDMLDVQPKLSSGDFIKTIIKDYHYFAQQT
ncbi:RDD family protein [Urechidicola sp. KH5]